MFYILRIFRIFIPTTLYDSVSTKLLLGGELRKPYTMLYLAMIAVLILILHYVANKDIILASFFLGCINKWSTVFITQNTCLYVLLAFMCLLFAPTSNNKMSLSSTQKKLHKIISILIIFTGLLIFYKIGHSNLTATIFYSFLCAIILMLIETILHLRINLFH